MHRAAASLRPPRRPVRDYAEVLAVIAAVTLGGWFAPVSYQALGYIYLLAIVGLSRRVGRWPVLAGTVVSAVAWNFVFVPPRLSFSVLHFDDSLLLAIYLAVALIVSQLSVLRAADQRARILAESERMHQTLLDSISHELKTPLAVFRSALEQLSRAEPPHRERLSREIQTALQRLDNLVANLLNQTRLESGVLKPRLDWCDGRELVDAARRALGAQLAGRTVAVEIPPDLPIFLADAALMEQAIGNLLLNAALHTPPPGAIRVDAGARPEAGWVFIAVSDEGPGIPPELRASLFDKFSRGPRAPSGGLGLGLSIVRGFMAAQGGGVAVDAAPGGGARFTLTLPWHAAEALPA
ncbi:MAG TPA: ATP-binding protein [Opitutaceae bacterium]|nr:ATP-binding protein [Opitutaceae bacterium]